MSFTIRVEHGKPDLPERSVYACAKYDVTYVAQADGSRVATLHLVDGSGSHTSEVKVADGASVYVMNAAGVTVDVIRPHGRSFARLRAELKTSGKG